MTSMEYKSQNLLHNCVFLCVMYTVNVTVTVITYHMYHSMYVTHLNYTCTQIHITAQAIDRMIKLL